jgi:hypothetical protein
MLPNELLLKIYNYSDYESRIKLNKIFRWSYYYKNPYFDYRLDNKKAINLINLLCKSNSEILLLMCIVCGINI